MFTLPRLTADEVGKESWVESHFPLSLASSPSLTRSLHLSRSVGRELRAAGATIAMATRSLSFFLCNFN